MAPRPLLLALLGRAPLRLLALMARAQMRLLALVSRSPMWLLSVVIAPIPFLSIAVGAFAAQPRAGINAPQSRILYGASYYSEYLPPDLGDDRLQTDVTL